MSDKKKDEIRSKELRVITSNPSRSKEGAGWKLRLVQYYKPATVTEGPKTVAIRVDEDGRPEPIAMPVPGDGVPCSR